MKRVIALNQVNAAILPAKILVLLSKYSQSVRKHTGLIVRISAMDVFVQVHNTNKITEHLDVRRIYRELQVEVNKSLLMGTMQTNAQRDETVQLRGQA